jgi:16S rRNA (cytidine1402-2'-O)-methyltransferase
VPLYIVPTPIGNLKDITRRAVEVLETVDFIVAEDTRHSRKLLSHLGIHKKIVSHYRPHERTQAEQIVGRLENQNAALISDSGTPVVSDPGFILVRMAIERNIPVIPLPGATAFIPALVASGISPEPFLFLGFSPRKEKGLERFLEEAAGLPYTLVFYESPRRAVRFLRTANKILGDRSFALAKEVSKKNEKIIRGRLGNLDEILEPETILGEIVIVIAGFAKRNNDTVALPLRNRQDLFDFFKKNHSISKNQLKKIWMK